MAGLGLGHKIAAGAGWVILQRLAVRSLGLISTMLLARLLVPEDFGLVALATTLLMVVETLMEMGFDLALIQRQSQSADRSQYDTAWTLSVARGFLAGLILVGAAYPLAEMYDDPRLVPIVMWLAVVSVATGFQNIGIVEFRIDLRFDQEFRLLVVSKIISFVVTIGLAWIWRDYRALVAGILTGKVAATVLSYTMHSYRPRFSLRGAIPFLHFSKWLMLNNVVSFIRSRLDTFVVGKMAGTTPLGYYNVAYEISNLATTELIWPISRVLFPGFAKLEGDHKRLANAFLASLGAMVLLGAPIAVGIGLTAEQIVRIFLGPQWLEVIPLIQVLSLYGLLNLPSSNGQALYLAIGRPDLIIWRNLPTVIVLPPALVAGVHFLGPVGAGWALVLGAVIAFVVHVWLVRRQLSVSIGDILRTLWRPVIGVVLMSAAVLTLEHYWPTETTLIGALIQIAAIAALGGVVYFTTVAALWFLAGRPPETEHHILNLARSWIEARRTMSLPRVL